MLLSVGGGSPIDAAKAVAYRLHKARGNQGQGREEAKWIPSIAVPTTLSVAETTKNAGFTNADGSKVAVADGELVPKGIVKCLFVLRTSMFMSFWVGGRVGREFPLQES